MPVNNLKPDFSSVAKKIHSVHAYIVDGLKALDSKSFLHDAWKRSPDDQLAGHGLSCVLEGGDVFERAGVMLSEVGGKELPAAAAANRPQAAGQPWQAVGVSLVLHPRNPYVPTVHMNVRFFSTQPSSGQEPVWWFGGGMDLTPYYVFEEDARHFHRVCADALAPFGQQYYPRFKQWCDEYFYLKHRQEARGVGGIFFDDFDELGLEQSFSLTEQVGKAFLDAYVPIVKKRRNCAYGERERTFQAFRRGRYVEFNLIYDRGTTFGLQSGGRAKSILASMPPIAQWCYNDEPEPNSPEAELYRYLPPRDWLSS